MASIPNEQDCVIDGSITAIVFGQYVAWLEELHNIVVGRHRHGEWASPEHVHDLGRVTAGDSFV